MEKENLGLAFAMHAAPDLDPNSFRGTASAFHNIIDAAWPTRIFPGSFAKSIRENASRIKILFQHQEHSPIGVPTKLEERKDGLFVQARVSDTTLGRDVLTLLRDRVLTELSIGFDALKEQFVEEDIGGIRTRVRHIKEVRLWEISIVTHGANSKATITDVNARANSHAVIRRVDNALAALDRRWKVIRGQDARDVQIDYLDALGKLR